MSSAIPNDANAMYSLDATFPMGASSHNPQAPVVMSAASISICKRCQHPGVDVKCLDCGCVLHARCTPVADNQNLGTCPVCRSHVRSLFLMPMNFDEIDAAKAAAATMSPSAKRGKKRKNATIARLNPSAGASNADESGDGSDLRTGRWTTEETLYCDKLIENFESGSLPIAEGVKLNDFLANMLKSKQSRLTKKMKNARLSAKTYKRSSGYIASFEQAQEFSNLEKSFFDSIQCDLERAEIRFHMQKEWRELFSAYCVAMGQKLDADSWLSSVEEMDRRVSQAKDAARMARRKVMMGYALSQDAMNQERGVFIENPTSTDVSSNEILSSHTSSSFGNVPKKQRGGNSARALRDFSSPFVGKVIQYIHRHQVPFEHIDAWVPSFVPNGDQAAAGNEQQKCRLCFAGFATTDAQIPSDGVRSEPLSGQDKFDMLSFGEYSSKFSFDVGCGLPGRVYSSGICSWEQGVANAPSHQFERCGGASQWGIKTVLGVPIPSPNVGRIVVLLYSRHDRTRDPEMVRRITEELTKLMPTPKWKLVVDIGDAPPKLEKSGTPVDNRVAEVLKLISEHIPTHRNSPYSPYLPGFTALRLVLVKHNKTSQEEDMLSTTLESYSSYRTSGRRDAEIAWMIARDFMLLSQSSNHNQMQQQHLQPVQHLQPAPAPQQPIVQHQSSQHQIHSQQSRHFNGQGSFSQISISNLAPGPAPQQQVQLGVAAPVAPQQHMPHMATQVQNNMLPISDVPAHHEHKQLQVDNHNHAPSHANLPGQVLMNGSHLQNSTSSLQPAPVNRTGFGLQQSAFQPVSHQQPPTGQQQNPNIRAN